MSAVPPPHGFSCCLPLRNIHVRNIHVPGEAESVGVERRCVSVHAGQSKRLDEAAAAYIQHEAGRVVVRCTGGLCASRDGDYPRVCGSLQRPQPTSEGSGSVRWTGNMEGELQCTHPTALLSTCALLTLGGEGGA